MLERLPRTLSTRFAAGVVCALVLAGCSSGADARESGDPARASGTASQPADPGTNSTGTDSTGSDSTGSGATGGSGAGATAPPSDYSSEPVVVESSESGQLVAVTADSGDGVDRLTFEFAGALPGYRVEQVPRVVAGPEGEVVEVEGESFLNVAFTSTRPQAGAAASEDVPTNESLDLDLLRQIVLVHNVAGSLWFGIGVDAEDPTFRLVPQANPNRLVLEVRG
jgi:hypothetical protein